MSIESFQNHIQQTANIFRSRGYKRVTLLHHNDADGLTSGAILQELFEREKLSVNRICLEKPYPEVIGPLLEKISGKHNAIFFADFGSGMLPTIKQLNKNGIDIFVLDHHLIEPIQCDNIFLINCTNHDISGSRDCSASAICALFALAMNKENSDLVGLGITGAYGDNHQDDLNQLSGVNKTLFDIAKNEGITRVKKEVLVKTGTTELNVRELIDTINALGSFGYLTDGPQLAIAILLDGVDDEAKEIAQKLRNTFKEELFVFLKELPLESSGNLQWFTLPEQFDNMGVKTVGLVCEELCECGLVDENKYLVGFQKIPSLIPDLEDVALEGIKVSMRLPKALAQRVLKKEALPLTEILPKAARAIGGFVDACHPHAAACTIKPNQDAELIKQLKLQLQQNP